MLPSLLKPVLGVGLLAFAITVLFMDGRLVPRVRDSPEDYSPAVDPLEGVSRTDRLLQDLTNVFSGQEHNASGPGVGALFKHFRDRQRAEARPTAVATWNLFVEILSHGNAAASCIGSRSSQVCGATDLAKLRAGMVTALWPTWMGDYFVYVLPAPDSFVLSVVRELFYRHGFLSSLQVVDAPGQPLSVALVLSELQQG